MNAEPRQMDVLAGTEIRFSWQQSNKTNLKITASEIWNEVEDDIPGIKSIGLFKVDDAVNINAEDYSVLGHAMFLVIFGHDQEASS